MDVTFYGWKIDEETRYLIQRMSMVLGSFIENKDIPINTLIVDVAVYGEVKHSNGYGLGFKKAIKQVSDSTGSLFGLPDAEMLFKRNNNQNYREEAIETLKQVASMIDNEPTCSSPTTMLVHKDNITVGREDADINISDSALRYIKDLRDLLGGGAIEITKGDIKIEIKEKNNGNN